MFSVTPDSLSTEVILACYGTITLALDHQGLINSHGVRVATDRALTRHLVPPSAGFLRLANSYKHRDPYFQEGFLRFPAKRESKVLGLLSFLGGSGGSGVREGDAVPFSSGLRALCKCPTCYLRPFCFWLPGVGQGPSPLADPW
jgi:hypothetical protein